MIYKYEIERLRQQLIGLIAHAVRKQKGNISVIHNCEKIAYENIMGGDNPRNVELYISYRRNGKVESGLLEHLYAGRKNSKCFVYDECDVHEIQLSDVTIDSLYDIAKFLQEYRYYADNLDLYMCSYCGSTATTQLALVQLNNDYRIYQLVENEPNIYWCPSCGRYEHPSKYDKDTIPKTYVDAWFNNLSVEMKEKIVDSSHKNPKYRDIETFYLHCNTYWGALSLATKREVWHEHRIL